MTVTQLPSLNDPGIDLWLVDLDAMPAPWDQASTGSPLSEQERTRADRFRFERDARRYRASHIALRTVLATVTGVSAQALVFVEGAFGKPHLQPPGLPHFNMSHSGGWALIGICHSVPIGVDIELLEPMDDLVALARRNFSREECEAFEATSGHLQLEAFLQCWTRKEACLKALGSGLSIEPHVFQAGLGTQRCRTSIGVEHAVVPMSVAHVPLNMPAIAACAWLDAGIASAVW
jgi:4'-phosphopantetheinyl transferase